jgi:hypothetical protein
VRGTSGPIENGDVIEEAFGILIVAFVSGGAMLMGSLFHDQMITHPNGRPTKGQSIVLVLIWLSGVSGVISIAGIISSWLGLTGGTV